MKYAFHKFRQFFENPTWGHKTHVWSAANHCKTRRFGQKTTPSSNLRSLGEELTLSCLSNEKILKTPRIMLPCSQQKLERTALRRRKMSGFKGFWWKGFFSLSLMCNCKVFGTSVSNRNNGKILGFSHSRSLLGNAILRAPVILYFFIELLRWGLPLCPLTEITNENDTFSNILKPASFLLQSH